MANRFRINNIRTLNKGYLNGAYPATTGTRYNVTTGRQEGIKNVAFNEAMSLMLGNLAKNPTYEVYTAEKAKVAPLLLSVEERATLPTVKAQETISARMIDSYKGGALFTLRNKIAMLKRSGASTQKAIEMIAPEITAWTEVSIDGTNKWQETLDLLSECSDGVIAELIWKNSWLKKTVVSFNLGYDTSLEKCEVIYETKTIERKATAEVVAKKNAARVTRGAKPLNDDQILMEINAANALLEEYERRKDAIDEIIAAYMAAFIEFMADHRHDDNLQPEAWELPQHITDADRRRYVEYNPEADVHSFANEVNELMFGSNLETYLTSDEVLAELRGSQESRFRWLPKDLALTKALKSEGVTTLDAFIEFIQSHRNDEYTPGDETSEGYKVGYGNEVGEICESFCQRLARILASNVVMKGQPAEEKNPIRFQFSYTTPSKPHGFITINLENALGGSFIKEAMEFGEELDF